MNYVNRKYSNGPQEDFTVPEDFQMDPFIFDYPDVDLVAFYYNSVGNCVAPMSGLQHLTEQWRYGFLEGGFDATEEIDYMESMMYDIVALFLELAKNIHRKAIHVAMLNPEYKRFNEIRMLGAENQTAQTEYIEVEEDLDEFLERFCEYIKDGMKVRGRCTSLVNFAINHEDFGKELKEAVDYLKTIHTIKVNMVEKVSAFFKEYE